MAPWDVDIAQLEERGYFILRGFVPPETCVAARAFVDGVIGAPSPVEQIETEGRGQPTGATVQQPQGFTSTNWPDPSSELPYLTSGNYRHGILPPVCGPFSCELLQQYCQLFPTLYHVPDDVTQLKLMNHMFFRTDPSPPGIVDPDTPPEGWHMDHCFLPRHYAAVPRQNYYHTMLALSSVPQGCANFYIDEPMYQASREIVAAIPEDEQTALAERYQPATKGLRPLITERIAEMGVVGEPRAVLMEEGDLIIFDPMMTHSASSNAGVHTTEPRYVCFTTMFHADAVGRSMFAERGRAVLAPPYKFRSALREGVRESLRGIFEWEMPLDSEEEPQPRL